MAEKKPWFGPNRVGWGLHPTSWQGWLIVLAVAGLAFLPGLLSLGR